MNPVTNQHNTTYCGKTVENIFSNQSTCNRRRLKIGIDSKEEDELKIYVQCQQPSFLMYPVQRSKNVIRILEYCGKE